MANQWEFLEQWTRENVSATAYDDKATAVLLANQCLLDARKAGFRDIDILRTVARQDLNGYMLTALNEAAGREVNRLVEKDKR